MSADVTRLLIVLRNHEHLMTVYGGRFVAAVLQALRAQIHALGGDVMDIGPSRFMAAMRVEDGDDSAFDTGVLIERWLIELTSAPMTIAERRALAVVSVDPVRCDGRSGAALVSYTTNHMDMTCFSTSASTLAPPRFDLQWRDGYERDMTLAAALYDELVQGRTGLAFQPIRLVTERQTGGEWSVLYEESLLRAPELSGGAGMAQLIPALERLGLIRAIDRAVLLQGLDRLSSNPGVRLGCNVSAQSLVPDSWWHSILARLARQPDIAARLTIEITETAEPPEIETALDLINRLKSLGCRIALDDFGAGHSSLGFAREARPDVIKLDAQWLRGARDSADGANALQRMVALCQCLAPDVVVEGVESLDDVNAAVAAGARWLQGFWVAPPAGGDPIAREVFRPQMPDGVP